MSLRIDRDARLFIYWDAVLDADPTGSSVILELDDTPYPMDWLGTAVKTGKRTWTQTARSQVLFIGQDRTPSGSDVLVAAGPHDGKPIVTFQDGQVVPCYPTVSITSL